MPQLIFLLHILLLSYVWCKHEGKSRFGLINVASMPYTASDMTATAFNGSLFQDNNGTRIYLTGGCIGNQYCNKNTTRCHCEYVTSSLIYYLVESAKFITVASMSNPRHRHMAVSIEDKLYVAGGRDSGDQIVSSIEVYDTSKNIWSEYIEWKNATSDGVAFTVKDLIIFINGYNNDYTEIPSNRMVFLNTTSNTFISKHPLTNDAIAQPITNRGDIQGYQIGFDLYVLGGYNVSAMDSCTPTNIIEKYSYQTNTWSVLSTAMSVGKADFSIGMIDIDLVIFGGGVTTTSRGSSGSSCPPSEPIDTIERLPINQPTIITSNNKLRTSQLREEIHYTAEKPPPPPKKPPSLTWRKDMNVSLSVFRAATATITWNHTRSHPIIIDDTDINRYSKNGTLLPAIYIFGGQGPSTQNNNSQKNDSYYYPINGNVWRYTYSINSLQDTNEVDDESEIFSERNITAISVSAAVIVVGIIGAYLIHRNNHQAKQTSNKSQIYPSNMKEEKEEKEGETVDAIKSDFIY